ncbi:MAG: sugar phosphate nucleotidyltransferase [Ilumatobacteraceae bacterium]
MVDAHIASGAGVTVAAIPVPIDEATAFGVIHADENDKIVEFVEKPPVPPAMPGDPTRALASMGNYVFTTEALIDAVTPAADGSGPSDVGGHVIPALTAKGEAYMYDFSLNEIPGQADHERGYWRDVGSLDAYYEANMDLLAAVPAFSLYNRQWPVYSLQLPLPPAKLAYGRSGRQAEVCNSLMSAGCIVSGAWVDASVLSNEVYVDSDAHVTESILFPGVHIGAGARVRRAVIDKNVDVPPGEVIGMDLERDRERFTVSDNGVVLIPKDYRFE